MMVDINTKAACGGTRAGNANGANKGNGPGAAASASGAFTLANGDSLIHGRPSKSTCHLGDCVSASVSRALRYALILRDAKSWHGLTIVLMRLSPEDIACIALAALRSLPEDTAYGVAEIALRHGAGMPGTPMFSHMDEAAFWADMAEPAELDAYCLACFRAMAPRRQRDFLDFVGRAAA